MQNNYTTFSLHMSYRRKHWWVWNIIVTLR